MRSLLILFLVLNFNFIYTQDKVDTFHMIPKDPEIGKCYKLCFEYDKRIEWLEIECDSLSSKRKSYSFSTRFSINYEEIKRYQERLISLGYKLNPSGFLDKRTVDAHHSYLKRKKKADKKEAKLLKKARRDSLKQIKPQNKRSQKAL